MSTVSSANQSASQLPVIDIQSLLAEKEGQDAVVDSIKKACESTGFFYIKTGVSPSLIARLELGAHRFFSKSVEEKEKIAMVKSGKAWRGFFKVGDELTSGRKDMKEGIYFGREESDFDGMTPLRGRNLFPEEADGTVLLRDEVLEYMNTMKRCGNALMRAISKSLPGATLEKHFVTDPTELFRIFSYPVPMSSEEQGNEIYGVGEHTDYGFLTILYQDPTGGLQVKVPSSTGEFVWQDVPYIEGTHVVNLGDALEHYTHGQFVATPHRVIYHGRPVSVEGKPRLSFPYFFDPCWTAPMTPMSIVGTATRGNNRWDGADPKQFEGTYGDYLQRKISRVFPQLFSEVVMCKETKVSKA
jgi:isopenicillin N synthase-like dioxygenase